MKNYCAQIHSVSGKILETFYEDFWDAVKQCTDSERENYCKQAQVFHYLNMTDPICVVRTLK